MGGIAVAYDWVPRYAQYYWTYSRALTLVDHQLLSAIGSLFPLRHSEKSSHVSFSASNLLRLYTAPPCSLGTPLCSLPAPSKAALLSFPERKR